MENGKLGASGGAHGAQFALSIADHQRRDMLIEVSKESMMHIEQMFRATAIGMVGACLVVVAAQAKDGKDDGSGSVIVVPAATCTELPVTAGAKSSRIDGAFAVRNGATANLLCPLPTDRLDASHESGKPKDFAVTYLDSDGPGAASVTVDLVRTEPADNTIPASRAA